MALKLLMIIMLAILAGYIIRRSLPRLRRAWQAFMRNPLMRTLLIGWLWRLIRLLLLRRF